MADQKLKSVRPKFVDTVTKPLISQILDELLLDEVLNRGQKDYILEENNLRDDMARRLIDAVISKGPIASQKMIDHIRVKDLSFYNNLDLSLDQPAPPAPEPQKEQTWATSLVPTTTDFWKKNQKNADIYPATIKGIGNRVALLITMINFADKKFDRHGAKQDEENMEQLLTGLGYEVVKHTNLTGKEIDEAVIKFSKHPKVKETDSVVVVISSHGKLGHVLGINHSDATPDLFPVDNIFKHLNAENCPTLIDKPKIIIIQACRGGKQGSVMANDGANPDVQCDDITQSGSSASGGEEDLEEDAMRYVNIEKDFLSLLSCTPGTVSNRHRIHGSIMIQFLFDVFNTFAHCDHVEELFRKIILRCEEFRVSHKMQVASKDRGTLSKHLYFYPGL